MASQPLATASLSSWLKSSPDDIDGGLAADFDGSLSGLGVELGTATYNMSEALLALPVFKQETLENGVGSTLPEVSADTVQCLLREVSNLRRDFQYVLGAATSPAQKINEETLTYLNQGQSYEVKLKKLGDATSHQGKVFKSILKVVFHERRLQFLEREQIETWKIQRPGERLIDIDVPLSYSLLDAKVSPRALNEIEVLWDPSKDTGVYIKVHCISTEFTPKKHGGEKGVPFRIQVETYDPEGEGKLLHCASCQVKVFKPKGADRKQKTDRDRMDKRSGAEKEKYQPSYDCTVLTEVPVEQVIESQRNTLNTSAPASQLNYEPPSPAASTTSQICSPSSPEDSQDSIPAAEVVDPLSPNADSKQVASWLRQNRFNQFVKIFQHFSGADLLRLTRDDLIQICGLPDGIRLNNALQSRAVRPRLTIYVCQDSQEVFHAIYLESLSSQDLLQKIASLFNISASQLSDIYLKGPSDIYVVVSNEVIQNIEDESRFVIEAHSDPNSQDCYRIILKSFT